MTKDQTLAAIRVKQAEMLKIVEDNWPVAAPPVEPPVEPPVVVPPVAGEDPARGYDFLDSFETDLNEKGKYGVHSGNSRDGIDIWNRVSAYTPGRHGKRAVRLTTLPGDVNHGSGNFERTDLVLSISESGGQKGKKHWWANSVLFPDNWQPVPTFAQRQGSYQSIFSFHWDGSTGQGNVNVNIKNWNGRDANNRLVNDKQHFHVNVWGGVDPGKSGEHTEQIMGGVEPVKNQWYDFLWYIEWGSASGKVNVWVRWGDSKVYKKQFVHNGPTLFRKSATEDYGAYLKVGNYHMGNTGKESSVVHDRIVRGPTLESVALFPVDTL